MNPDALVASYDAALARLAADHPPPGAAGRLIDPLLRLFGADARTRAQAERADLLDRAARHEVAAGNIERAAALDAALRRRAARPAPGGA